MNESEGQEGQILVGSDMEYESEYSTSGSDDSDGEVPDVIDQSASNPHNNNVTGQGQLASPSSRASSAANPGNPSVKDSTFGAWKPVIDGKIQVGGEVTLNFRPPSTQAVSTGNSSQNKSNSDRTSPSPGATGSSDPRKYENESDCDVRRVPEMAAKGLTTGTTSQAQGPSPGGARSRKREGGVDKEHKRLKRLLRNRVSAQQARERKKAYLSELEVKSKELELANAELEERVTILSRENFMLRQVVKNTTGKIMGPVGEA